MDGFHRDKYRTAINAALSLFLGAAATYAAWVLLVPHAFDPVAQQSGVDLPETSHSGERDRSSPSESSPRGFSIAGEHPLFGRSPEAESSAPEMLPESRINIELTGVSDRSGGDGVALVRTGDAQKTEVVRPGDTLRNSEKIRIHGIHADHIVIQRDGQLERISLDEEAMLEARQRPDPSGGKTGLRDASVSRETVSRWRERPETLMEDLAPEPILKNGGLEGIRIGGVPEGHPAAQAGLEEDDIIRAVAGRELKNVANPNELTDAIENADMIPMIVDRGGREMDIKIEIEGQ
ncbi:type II secretion system protein N [Thioalkalivibrio sp. ALE19]|uniref:type II secretion system protein N n=1 Tax=Thioalkalivibrio sp. ALE19 TaxID=1266909 RepID=UPI000402E6CE|nr:type II secretion system protein N [Thioalkalivibrio sp. ALE19]